MYVANFVLTGIRLIERRISTEMVSKWMILMSFDCGELSELCVHGAVLIRSASLLYVALPCHACFLTRISGFFSFILEAKGESPRRQKCSYKCCMSSY